MTVAFTFVGDMAGSRNGTCLMQSITYDLMEHSRIIHVSLAVTTSSEGFVTLNATIHALLDKGNEEQTIRFTYILKERPQEIFIDYYIQEFGTFTIRATNPSECTKAPTRLLFSSSSLARVGTMCFMLCCRPIRFW